MNVKSIIATILIASSLIGSGKEIKVGDIEIAGSKYKKATIEYSSGLNAKIHHDEGVKTIPISQLTQEYQATLGITTDTIASEIGKAKEQRKVAAEKHAKLKKQIEQKKQELARSEKYSVIVYGHTKDAALVYAARSYEHTTPAITSGLGSVGGGGGYIKSFSYTVYREIKSEPYKVVGFKNPAVYKKGQVLHFRAIPNGNTTIDGKSFPILKFLKFIKDQ